MKTILTITGKELKLLFRDPGGLIMLFVLPALFIFVLSIALQGVFSSAGNKEKIKILVVNDDKTNAGTEIIDGLRSIPIFSLVERLDGKDIGLDTAKKELENGNYKIAIYLPENMQDALNFKTEKYIDIYVDPVLSNDFAQNISNAVQNYISMTLVKNISRVSLNIFNDINKKRTDEIERQISDTAIKKSQILKQWADAESSDIDDTSKSIIKKLTDDNISELTSKINELENQKKNFSGSAKANEGMLKAQYDVSGSKVGLKVNQIFYSANAKETMPNSVQQNVPGWTIFALFWIIQVLSMNIIMERQSGVFKRILVSPIRKIEYILGKILPFFIINMLQAIIMFSIGLFILPLFGCPKFEIHNFFALFFMTLSVSLTAISLGLFISTVSDSIFLIASFSALLLIILSVIGGIMIPSFVMPGFMQKMSLFVPQGWALDGYLKVLVKSQGIIRILPNIAVLAVFSAVFFIISFFRIYGRSSD
jgi:ABC-2 type transport system permease protein